MKTALCVGINNYPGEVNDLDQCILDAERWSNLLVMDFGFHRVKRLFDYQATRQFIKTELTRQVTEAQPGDVVVFTYSGHGTQVYDASGDEADGYDEALYVYDGCILDDELREIFQLAREGVHIAVILDSCFSGTATRKPAKHHKIRYWPVMRVPAGIPKKKKCLSEEGMIEVLLTACKDNEVAYETPDGGALSRYAELSLGVGDTYNEWYDTLKEYLPSEKYPQTPQLEGRKEIKRIPVFDYVDTGVIPDYPEWDDEIETGESWLSKWLSVIGIIGIIGLLFLMMMLICK